MSENLWFYTGLYIIFLPFHTISYILLQLLFPDNGFINFYLSGGSEFLQKHASDLNDDGACYAQGIVDNDCDKKNYEDQLFDNVMADIYNSETDDDELYKNTSGIMETESEKETEDESENDNDSESESSENDSDKNLRKDDNNGHYCFDKIMFLQSGLTVRDIIILSTAYSLRHNISDEGRLEFVHILEHCAGPEFQNLNLSKYIMNKCFSAQNEHMTYHYYCSNCSAKIIHTIKGDQKLKKHNSVCQNCEKINNITANSPNYFISINLSYQIKKLLSNEIILNDILNNVRQTHNVDSISNNSSIKDVHNSAIFRKIVGTSTSDHQYNNYIVTLNFNTDGAPLTRSGKTAF